MIRTIRSGRARLLALLLLAMLCLVPNASRADSIITDWHPIVIGACVANARPPTISTHVLSAIFTAAYDAWAAYDPVAVGHITRTALDGTGGANTPANIEEAVSNAIYTVLSTFTPTNQAAFDAQMALQGYGTNDMTLPAILGRAAAQAVITAKENDGSNRLGGYADTSGYTPQSPTVLDSWQPLVISGTPQTPLTPHWGDVEPFAMYSGDQFQPAPPAAYGTPEWDAQVQEIIDVSAALTDTQKATVEYWLPLAGRTPPMLWGELTTQFSVQEGFTLEEDIKLFFIIHNAQFDAGISCWKTKYITDYARPITAVRNLGTTMINAWGGPGQGTQSIQAQNFLPYQPATAPTPPFPEYTSGHSTFGAAWAECMERFTGDTAFGLSTTITNLVIDGTTPGTPITLTWPTFADASTESSNSRLYGGIHFTDGNVNGRAMGRLIGEHAYLYAQSLFAGAPLAAEEWNMFE